jgi:hypothetical protein
MKEGLGQDAPAASPYWLLELRDNGAAAMGRPLPITDGVG